MIYKNTTHNHNTISFKKFFIENLALCLSVAGFIAIIIGTMAFIIIRMRFNQIKASKEILFQKTQIDSLTNVYNREACEHLVKDYLKNKESSLYGAFIIIDIDYFKQINDKLGHKIGDKLLIEFGRLLKDVFSNTDIVSRLGGDEFIVFMKDIEEYNLKKVDNKLQELCQIMNKEIEHGGCSQRISLSIGSVVTKYNIEFEQLYQMADETLYEVKRNGKNGFKVRYN